tara:strand:- start:8195 stop:8746 length:552 start_codon:yes stop_codon:yes gene_type:complete
MEELEKELEDLPENFIVGVVMPNDKYEEANMHLLSFLINRKKSSGGYVSVSKPYSSILNSLKNKEISTDNIQFIDCISKGLGGEICKGDKCVLVESPAHLTELGIALHDYFTSTGEKNRFVYIDSISSLLIHNNMDSILKFVHSVTGKMRVFGFNGIILSQHEESDQKLTSQLSQFCDKVIHL